MKHTLKELHEQNITIGVKNKREWNSLMKWFGKQGVKWESGHKSTSPQKLHEYIKYIRKNAIEYDGKKLWVVALDWCKYFNHEVISYQDFIEEGKKEKSLSTQIRLKMRDLYFTNSSESDEIYLNAVRCDLCSKLLCYGSNNVISAAIICPECFKEVRKAYKKTTVSEIEYKSSRHENIKLEKLRLGEFLDKNFTALKESIGIFS